MAYFRRASYWDCGRRGKWHLIEAIAYILFAAAAPLATIRLAPHRAVWLVYAAGLMLLPPTIYPDNLAGSTLGWRVIGNALPSEPALSGAMAAAFAALLTVILRDGPALARWRPGWLDLPMALFCLWPLAQDLLLPGASRPSGPVAALSLLLVWGVPWVLGRIYLASTAGRAAFSASLAWLMVALSPFAIAEGLFDWRLYEAVIGPHPFASDGHQRYLGYRPLLLFENGNQYGLYICMAALLAVGRAAGRQRGERRAEPAIVAGYLVALAVASQSVGAILLSALIAAAFWLCRMGRRARMLVLAGATAAAAALAAFSSGLVPVRHLAEATGIAEPAKVILDSLGRHSLAWRMSQNDKTAALIRDGLPFGHANWDWFAAAGTRPWGFWSLLAGQFGVVSAFALALTAGIALVSASRGTDRAGFDSTHRNGLLVFQIVTAVALLDAVLNSFIFYPVSATMAACLAGWARSAETKTPADSARVP